MSITIENSRIGHLPDAGWTADGGTTSPANFPSGASLYVAGAIYDAASGPVTIVDGQFNTWVPLTERISIAGSGNIKARLWYVPNPVGISPNNNFTFNGTNGFIQGMVAGFLGTSPTPFDAEGGNGTANGTSIQPGPVVPTENNELVISIAGYNVQSVTNFDSIDSGFNFLFNSSGVAAQRFPAMMSFKIQVDKKTENPIYHYPLNGAGVAAIAAFKSASGLIPELAFSFAVGAKRV